MVGFTSKYLFMGISIFVAIWLIYLLPPEWVIILSIIPGMIYSIYIKRFFLFICVLIIVAAFIVMLNFAIYPSFSQLSYYMIYLYGILYPYQLGDQFSMFYDPFFLFLAFAFLIFIVCVSGLIRFSPFKTMLSVSYLIWGFSCVYILFNMVTYLIPFIKDIMLSNYYVKWFAMFFYGMLPFVCLTLMLFFILTLYSWRNRIEYQKEVGKIRFDKKRRTYQILKYIGVIAILIMLVLTIVFFIG